MPISEQSLRITDAYRDYVRALVENVQHYSDATWSGDRWLAATAAAVAGAQREAVRATGGYLAAYLSSELGRQVRVPLLNSLSYAGKSRDGQPLNDALLSPLIGLASQLKEGLDEPVARANAVKRAKDLIDLAVKEAARRSLQDAMKDEPLIVGWRRAVSGTCDACLGAADETTAPPGTPMDIHPGCECVSEPSVRIPGGETRQDLRQSGQEIFSRMTPAEQDVAFGKEKADLLRAETITLADCVDRSNIRHGQDFITSKPLKDLPGSGEPPISSAMLRKGSQ